MDVLKINDDDDDDEALKLFYPRFLTTASRMNKPLAGVVGSASLSLPYSSSSPGAVRPSQPSPPSSLASAPERFHSPASVDSVRRLSRVSWSRRPARVSDSRRFRLAARRWFSSTSAPVAKSPAVVDTRTSSPAAASPESGPAVQSEIGQATD